MVIQFTQNCKIANFHIVLIFTNLSNGVWVHFHGKQLFHFLFVSLLNGGQLLKARICSTRFFFHSFFESRWNFKNGVFVQERKLKSNKTCYHHDSPNESLHLTKSNMITISLDLYQRKILHSFVEKPFIWFFPSRYHPKNLEPSH